MIKKYVLLLLAGLAIGSVATSILIIKYQLPLKITKVVNFKASPSPVVLPSPTPTPVATEKSLRVAAFAWARATEAEMKDLKQKYQAEDKSDTQFLYIWALEMDKDPALYAKNEAIMEKTISTENRNSDNSKTQSINTQTKNNPANCTPTNIGYSDYFICK